MTTPTPSAESTIQALQCPDVLTIEAQFPRGRCPVRFFGSLADRHRPIVLLFPDAFGPRPAIERIAHDLCEQGWRVAMPDLFYELAPYEPLVPKSVFDGTGHDRLMALYGTIDQEKICTDTSALLELIGLHCREDVPIAAAGYCMGGRYALTAATTSSRMVFAAAFHASALAPAEPESRPLRLTGTRARIYIGAAGIDPTYDAAEHGRLAEALRAAGTDHVIETYSDCAHGWTMSDLPVYAAPAASKHLRRLHENLKELCPC